MTRQIDEKVVEACLTDILLSEVESYQQLYGMLTENQSSLLHAIARERIVIIRKINVLVSYTDM